MNFEGIIAIINLNQWFITAIMWSFLLMVSRAACTIALKMFLWWLISQRGGLPSAAHSSAQGKAEDTSGAADGLGSVLQGSGVEQGTEASPLTSIVFPYCRTSDVYGMGTPGHICPA